MFYFKLQAVKLQRRIIPLTSWRKKKDCKTTRNALVPLAVGQNVDSPSHTANSLNLCKDLCKSGYHHSRFFLKSYMLQSPAACSKTLLLTPSQSGREAGKTPPVFLLAFVSKVDVRLNACLQFHPRPRFCCKTIYPPGALADFYRKTFCFLSAAAFRGSSTKHDVFLK